jgi:hypothetical protein
MPRKTGRPEGAPELTEATDFARLRRRSMQLALEIIGTLDDLEHRSDRTGANPNGPHPHRKEGKPSFVFSFSHFLAEGCAARKSSVNQITLRTSRPAI